MTHDKFEQDEEIEFKSKTQIKNEMHELQKIGLSLVELSQADLAKIPLPSDLLDAVTLARKINKKKEGYRRQLQFIGKLMRSTDTQPIEDALNKLQSQHHEKNEFFHQLEDMRDNIVSKNDDFIHELCQTYPNLELQKLRQLARQAKKEQAAESAPKAKREIFKYLKSQIEE